MGRLYSKYDDQVSLFSDLTMDDLVNSLGMSRSSIDRRRRANLFPPPAYLRCHKLVWREDQVIDFINELNERNNEKYAEL